MDHSELHRSLYKALSDIEHSVEGALILGRHASDSVARLQALCEDVIKNFGVTGHVSKVNASNLSDSQHSGMKIPAVQVNGMNGVMSDRFQALSSTDQHVELRNAKIVQRTDRDPSQTCEPIAIHQSLRATNARLLGLMENLGDSHKNRFEQERISLEDTIQQQAAQLAAREAQIASDKAEIAAKEAKISLLKRQDQVLRKVESSLPKGAATFKPQASLVTPAPEHREMSTHANQSMLFQGYLLPTRQQQLQQQEYKQIALGKEKDSKDAFEAFMRTMQNSNAGLYEKLTDSSGHYVSPSRPINVNPSIHDQPRKVPEKKLTPETPPFMPSSGQSGQSTMPSVANTQNQPRKLLRAPAGPQLEVIVESKDEDTTEAQIKEKVASANGESAADSEIVLPNTSPTTVKEMAIHDSSASAKNDGAVSLPDMDASFDTFVEQQLKASTPIPSGSSAEVSHIIADSPSHSTRGIRLPQEPRGVDDLIVLSSNETTPVKDKKEVVKNAANDSAAFLAAATTAYSTFNATRYASQSNVEAPGEQEDSEDTSTDDSAEWDRDAFGTPVLDSRASLYRSTTPPPLAPRAYLGENQKIQTWKSGRYPLFPGFYMNTYERVFLHKDRCVEKYVVRMKSRGSFYELKLEWKSVSGGDGGKTYWVLDRKKAQSVFDEGNQGMGWFDGRTGLYRLTPEEEEAERAAAHQHHPDKYVQLLKARSTK